MSPITLVAIALSSFPSLLLSTKAIGQPKCSAYLYAFLELPASVATTTLFSISFTFFLRLVSPDQKPIGSVLPLS